MADKEVSGIYVRDSGEELMYHDIHRSWLENLDASETVYQKAGLSGLLGNSFLENFLGSFVEIDKEADIYIVEGPSAVFGLNEVRKKNPDAEIIYLATSWKLYGLQPYNLGKENAKNHLRAIDESINSFLTRKYVKKYCDKIITVSPLYREKLKSIFPEKDIQVVKPSSDKEIEADFKFESFNAIFVGEDRDHKGVDLLVRSWSKVREEIENAHLTIVGEGHDYDTEGVNCRGFVEDLEDAYQNKSLYVHPARMDAFPVSTIEAMKSGLPTIVTDQTGTKSEIAKISKELIVEPKPEELAKRVITYFRKSKEEKHELSQKFQQETEELTYEKSEKEFKEAVLK